MNIVVPDSGSIGAEIHDVDITKMDRGDAEEILSLIYKHRIVVIRDQHPNDQEYVDFSRKLGTPQIYFQDHYHHPSHPEIFVSTNIRENGKKVGVSGTGRYWHTDCSFEKLPLSLTMLHPKVLPSGYRATHYIDLSKVYNALSGEMRSYVDDTYAIHDCKMRYKVQISDEDRAIYEILDELARDYPPAIHPTIIVHPVTKEKILYISEGFTTAIKGLSHEDNREVLGHLFEFMKQDKFMHKHPYSEGDVIIWDNRFLIHKSFNATRQDPNKNYRIGIYDGLPFYSNKNLYAEELAEECA